MEIKINREKERKEDKREREEKEREKKLINIIMKLNNVPM